MSSKYTPISGATLALSLACFPDGLAVAMIRASLPSAEPFSRDLWCLLREPDEAATWADDFHGESKAWRSLMDCVASDWVLQHRKMFGTTLYG